MARLMCAVGLWGLVAGEPARSTWQGYERLDFRVGDRAAWLIVPREPAPGRPWIWRTEFFGHEPQADLALLGHGFHVAYLDVQNLYGGPPAMAAMDECHALLRERYQLAEQVVLEGFSRGGLFALNWAARRPAKVAAIYLDAPVCDVRSWPGGFGRGPGSPDDWRRLLAVYGLTEAQARADGGSPIDRLAPLAAARIPILSVCGETDATVPIEENSRVLEARYKALGGSIEVIAKPHNDHHPHSFRDPLRIVNWILRATGRADRITAEPATPYGYDYFTLRGGLANSRVRFSRDKVGRVVFLGGSITAGSGWRELVCADLRRRFPETRFDFHNAGIPSVDSTGHAFRCARDVLAHGPVDLLFVEAAVNDSTNGRTAVEQLRGMEGVVRQARLSQPAMDIVLLHFADPDKLADYTAGRTPEVIATHEAVAERYALPSLDLAREVTERIHAGEFTWAGDFRDLHPSPFGHRLYAAGVGRLLDAAWTGAADEMRTHTVPKPLDPLSYWRGRLVPLDAAELVSGWTLEPAWRPADKAGTRAGFVDLPALCASEPGATLKFRFRGTAVGLFVAAGPDAGRVEFSVDGGPVQERELFTPWSRGLHLPWAQILAADLPAGEHELVLTVARTANPASVGHAARIFHLLAN